MPTWATFTPYGGTFVNAAFLLVTTACFAGQTPAPDVKAAPAQVTPAPVVAGQGYGQGSYNGTYNSSCGCGSSNYSSSCGCDWGYTTGHKLRGLFSRGGHGHSSDCGCDAGCGTGHTRNWSWSGSSCNSCGSSCDSGCGGHGMFGKLKGMFGRGHGHSSDCGCDGGCGSYGSGSYSGGCANGSCGSTYTGGTPYNATPYNQGVPTQQGVPAQQGESLTVPPKKMPTPPIKEANPAPKQEVRNNTTTPIVPAPQVAPTIEVVPPAIPPVVNGQRSF